jgi:hypothetical protein
MRASAARDNAGKHYSAVENVQGKARSAPICWIVQHNANAGAMVPACFKCFVRFFGKCLGLVYAGPLHPNCCLNQSVRLSENLRVKTYQKGRSAAVISYHFKHETREPAEVPTSPKCFHAIWLIALVRWAFDRGNGT